MNGINEMKSKWKPKHCEDYYFISERYNKVLKDTFNKYDTRHKERYFCGNCFKTQTEASARFEDYIKEINYYYDFL